MNPLYSVLLYNQNIDTYRKQIYEWLLYGIKVFWFGDQASVNLLKSDFIDFADAYLLQVFDIGFKSDDEEVDYDFASEMGYTGLNDSSMLNGGQTVIDGVDDSDE